MPMITTRDGTTLFVRDWGRGRPIVLLHGWPLSGDMWEYQSPLLGARGYRVIAHDRRGFGRSDQPWTGYDYDSFADDLADILTALDVRDAILVGFSMGGGEAVRYLARHGSDRVAGLVLLSSVTPYLLKAEDNPGGVEVSVFDDMVKPLNDDRPAFLAAFGKKFMSITMPGITVSAEMMQWVGNLALMASPKATIDCVRAFSETDFRADVRAVRVPTLIIHGDDDQTVPIKVSGEATHKLLPHAEYRVYKGAPHGLFITEKTRLVNDIAAFVGSLPAR